MTNSEETNLKAYKLSEEPIEINLVNPSYKFREDDWQVDEKFNSNIKNIYNIENNFLEEKKLEEKNLIEKELEEKKLDASAAPTYTAYMYNNSFNVSDEEHEEPSVFPPQPRTFPQPVTVPIPTMPPQPLTPINYEEPKRKTKTGFGKKVAAACLVAVLGLSSLGVGLGFGGSIANKYFFADDYETGEELVFTFDTPTGSVKEVSIQNHNFSDIVKDVSTAVVSINVSTQVQSYFNQIQEQKGAGSGIIFNEDNEKVYIATNNHVIENASHVTISIDDKSQVNASFVGSDPQSDLAVISVLKTELQKAIVSYKIAKIGDSSLMEVGDEVVAIGNALGEGKIATSGIISAINKQIPIDGKTLTVIQTDAAINFGNSGGALVNLNGEIIGINTAKLASTGVEGMGYSIPSNEAKKVIEELILNGSVQKPFLGIIGETVTDQMKDMYNLPSYGVLVHEATVGYGADLAGLQRADIIVAYNGKEIKNIEELSSAISKSKVNDIAAIDIYRRGQLITLQATIGDMNAEPKF